MKPFNKFWQIFKSQPDIWFFYGFLLTFTLSIRKVLFLYPINGQFNEYTSIYLYLSDVFLILTILIWGYRILYNNKYHLSTNPLSSLSLKMFHVEHLFRNKLLYIPVLLIIWSGISIIWAENKNLALFRSIKLAEFYLLYLYIVYNVPRGTLFKRLAQIIISLGVIQSLVAIWQFVIQQSIGLLWLRESIIGIDIAGVAKLIVDGHKIVRAYGLFPHPNILGGFLLISIILSFIYYTCHSEQSGARSKNLIRSLDKLEMTVISIQILALILTFSKSAWIGLILACAYIAYANVPRGTKVLARLRTMFHARPVTSNCSTWNNLRFFGVEHFRRKIILALGILLVLAFIARPDTNSLLFKSLNERLFYLNVSYGTISANPIVGTGSGQFVSEMDKYVPYGTIIESWQYQPVHNVFLLIWSELGIVGLILFVLWLWKLFRVEQKIAAPNVNCSTWNNGCKVYELMKQDIVPRPPRVDERSQRVEAGGTMLTQHKILTVFKGALLGLIFIMLFDHSLWDIQQGQLLLWLVAGLIVGLAKNVSIDK